MDREPPVGAELDGLVERLRTRTLGSARRSSWLAQTPRMLAAALIVALLLAAGVTAATRILSSPPAPPAVGPTAPVSPTGSSSPVPSGVSITATPLPAPTIALQGTAVDSAGFAGAYGWRLRPPLYTLEITADDGLHWTGDPVPGALAPLLRPHQNQADGLTIDVSASGAIVLAHATKTGEVEIAVQTAPGQTWTTQTVASGADPGELRGAGMQLLVSQAPGGFIAISLNVGQTMNSGWNYLLDSYDGGASFERVGLQNWTFRSMVFANADVGVAITNPGGLLDATADGGRTWAIVSKPLGAQLLEGALAIAALGDQVIVETSTSGAGDPSYALIATTDGRSFTRLTQPGPGLWSLAASGDRLAALNGTALYLSDDGARSWRTTPSTVVPELNAAQPFAIGPDGRVAVLAQLRECVGSKLDGSLSCAQTHETMTVAPDGGEWVAER